jgi:TonB family protein
VKVDAPYTAEARAAGLQGTVSLYVELSPNGKPSDVEVMEGLGLGLDAAAVNAVKRWEFSAGGHGPDAMSDALEIDIPSGWTRRVHGVPKANSTALPSLPATAMATSFGRCRSATWLPTRRLAANRVRLPCN